MKRRWSMIAVAIAMCACSNERAADSLQADAEVATPPGLHEESSTYDPRRHRLVLVGGIYADSAAEGGYAALSDVYEWESGRWLRHRATDSMPVGRALASLEFDPRNGRVMLVGGSAYAAHGEPGSIRPCPSCPSIKAMNDVWSYDGRTWTRHDSAPSVNHPRLVFDSRRQQMLLIGSHGNLLGVDGAHPLMLWRQEGERWVLADTTGPRLDSPPRATFDATRGVLVLPILEGPDAGVWEWDGQWKRVVAHGGPATRDRFVLTFDQSRSLIMLFGGRSSENQYFNDLWSWDGVTWTRIAADSTTSPTPRSDGSLFHEPGTNRLILIGGLGPNDLLHRQTWAFANARWSRLE